MESDLNLSETEWFQGYYWPDGPDKYVYLPTCIKERYGQQTLEDMIKAGQARIDKGSAFAYGGSEWDPKDHKVWFCTCQALGQITGAETGFECAEGVKLVQTKNNTNTQPKGQSKLACPRHQKKVGTPYNRELRLQSYTYVKGAKRAQANKPTYAEDPAKWHADWDPYLPVFELLIEGWMYMQNWLAKKAGHSMIPYPKSSVFIATKSGPLKKLLAPAQKKAKPAGSGSVVTPAIKNVKPSLVPSTLDNWKQHRIDPKAKYDQPPPTKRTKFSAIVATKTDTPEPGSANKSTSSESLELARTLKQAGFGAMEVAKAIQEAALNDQ